jgi:hypothetical protein
LRLFPLLKLFQEIEFKKHFEFAHVKSSSGYCRILSSWKDFRIKYVKGTVPRDEYFVPAYNNKYVLSVLALIVFPIFCLLAPLKLLTSLENHVTRFTDPKAAILTMKMLTGSLL